MTFNDMTNNRHFWGGLEIINLSVVSRPEFDQNSKISHESSQETQGYRCYCNLTTPLSSRHDRIQWRRPKGQRILGIHGTRVNVLPIIQRNPSTIIQGTHDCVDFGYGIYFATDWKKVTDMLVQMTLLQKSGHEGRVENRNYFDLIRCHHGRSILLPVPAHGLSSSKQRQYRYVSTQHQYFG